MAVMSSNTATNNPIAKAVSQNCTPKDELWSPGVTVKVDINVDTNVLE